MRIKAFTLIELLVVIAIIAILAAILFPVFAQAKLQAKKITSVSNVKQVGLALYMYVNDADDVTPKLGDGVDWTNQVYPYVKNENLFLDPVRNDMDGGCLKNGAPYPGAGSDEPGCRYVGYGYNWGRFNDAEAACCWISSPTPIILRQETGFPESR